MTLETFSKAWEDLEKIQKDAASWNDGPLLVLAGPGSGKTKVLTCRIARLLIESPDKNFRILALTFTNKAADEMRGRVASFIPGEEGRLFIGTFHSFCADILRQHGLHLGINPNFQIYSQENDLQAVLDEAVKEAKSKSNLVEDTHKRTLSVIQRLKSKLILPEQCEIFYDDPVFGKAIKIVYSEYENQLAKRNALDFNSLILNAYLLFNKFPVLASRYQKVYPYVCIDEFQDTNEAQYQFIRSLIDLKFNNLFVVADDDQIIYQWNGASYKRLEELEKDYSPKILQLPVVYRCPYEIVVIANNLIQYNFIRTPNKKPLKAYNSTPSNETLSLLPPFPNFDSEASGIAKNNKEIHSGELGSVVILARSRKLILGAAEALKKLGVPAIILQRKDEFSSTPLIWLHAALKLANDRLDRKSLSALSGSFFQITGVNVDPEDVITQAGAANNDFLLQWIKSVPSLSSNHQMKELINNLFQNLGEGRNFIAFSQLAIKWFDEFQEQHKDGATNPDEGEEFFAQYGEEKLVWEQLKREIMQSLGNQPSLEAFLQELQMRSKEPIPKKNQAVLMTIHGAKGKEFDHVYLIGLVEDELPSYQSKKKGPSSSEMEEERRNCFVAITRTMKTLTLSYAMNYWGWPKKPSRFLSEMGLLESESGKLEI
jgi:DNA helicase-2/ATP-dependent DNA helicase PcrA